MTVELVFEFPPETVNPIDLLFGETAETPVILPFLMDTMFTV